MKRKIIFFDTETNGLKETDSVLSISAMKIEYDSETKTMRELGKYNRFYYINLGEEPNEKALSVNGLYEDEITKRRNESFALENTTYPKYFKDDIMGFYNFCDGATHFVAHNIKFDRIFIPFPLLHQFDTMLANVDILKLPNSKYSSYRYPKLLECADFYNVKLEENMLHQSMYDVIIMARVFYVMFKKGHKDLLKFIND